jgi:hypothetical protein
MLTRSSRVLEADDVWSKDEVAVDENYVVAESTPIKHGSRADIFTFDRFTAEWC